MTIAERLVNDLMLVSVLVAGQGDAALVAELETAGAAAVTLSNAAGGAGYDLAILLADPRRAADLDVRAAAQALSVVSERLLFAPVPLGQAAPGGAPALPELTQWFEVFAEFGYQPVLEFDAAFVSPGAFLVDRAAIAAEGELAEFADRLQLGADEVSARERRGAAKAEDTGAALRAGLEKAEAALVAARASLETERALAAQLAARIAELAARHDRVQGELAQARVENAGWDALRHWVRAAAADPSRDSLESLARALPQLNALRGEAAPLALPAPARRGFWRRRAAPPRPTLLDDMALVRASPLFDAAWYIASMPELAAGAPLDPVFHYVLVGADRGADPGPWFDSATYLANHPELAGTPTVPLVHAIRFGNDRVVQAGGG